MQVVLENVLLNGTYDIVINTIDGLTQIELVLPSASNILATKTNALGMHFLTDIPASELINQDDVVELIHQASKIFFEAILQDISLKSLKYVCASTQLREWRVIDFEDNEFSAVLQKSTLTVHFETLNAEQ